LTTSWPGTFVCRNTVPEKTTGELCPSPTRARQTTFGAPVHGLTVSADEPSRLGPSHCGQSAATRSTAQSARSRRIGVTPEKRAAIRLDVFLPLSHEGRGGEDNASFKNTCSGA